MNTYDFFCDNGGEVSFTAAYFAKHCEHITIEPSHTILGDPIHIAVYATGATLFTGWDAREDLQS